MLFTEYSRSQISIRKTKIAIIPRKEVASADTLEVLSFMVFETRIHMYIIFEIYHR